MPKCSTSCRRLATPSCHVHACCLECTQDVWSFVGLQSPASSQLCRPKRGALSSPIWCKEAPLRMAQPSHCTLNCRGMLQEGGTDHFQLVTRSGVMRKGPQRERVRSHLAHFWDKLTTGGHTAGIDVLEVLDPITDCCVLLCACAAPLFMRFYETCFVAPLPWAHSAATQWNAHVLASTLAATCRSRILVMRYAGVSIALSIMTAFVEIIVLEEKKRTRAEQQLKAEEAKTFKKGAASSQKKGGAAEESRVATLRRDFNRLHSSVSAMEARLAALFEHFVARQCREVMPVVRRDVVEALGRWTMACPESFMKDNRLKYIAWGMSDRV